MSPRTCPKCQELYPPDATFCQPCGVYIIEPRQIEKGTPEHDQIMDDWAKTWLALGVRIVDPERDERGDTARVPGSIPPKDRP